MARGFLGTVLKIAREAERDARRRQREAERENAQLHREHARTQKAREQARKQADRASAADAKRQAAEAKQAHLEAQQAEVEALNAELEETYAGLDGLLEATLDVDDYFDLKTLRQQAAHPAFSGGQLELPTVMPPLPGEPSEPVFEPPPPSKALFGRKKKAAAALAQAEEIHSGAIENWRGQMAATAERKQQLQAEHRRAEKLRLAKLTEAKTLYQRECETREREATEYNTELDELIANLGYGVADAIEKYLWIVFYRSIYPDGFSVEHETRFDSSTAEVVVRAAITPPDEISALKSYRYVKKNDEIVSSELSQKARKDRYASIVDQVALRTIHEVFEADRRGLAKMISLEVGTNAKSPATGKTEFIPFAAVAVDRETFIDFDLSGVVPRSSLEHLGASRSKNPYNLVAADTAGIRRQ